MLSDEVVDKVIERLVNRIEQGNEYILNQIGKSIRQLGTVTPSHAHQLAQVLKYGGDYQKIVNKLAKITELNVKDIYKIFEEVAKSDYKFAKQFYDYKGVKYIPYEQNTALQSHVKALASITAGKYINMSNSTAFARKKGIFGRIQYTDLSRTYQEAIDKAVLNIGQGKETFDNAMRSTLRELGESGIRTVDYASGRSMRLDSAVRMNMQTALRDLRFETQKEFGKQFGADGYEITVHINPAPDHADAQGRQFSSNQYDKSGNLIKEGEYEKLQRTGKAVDYNGHDVNIKTKYGHRRIREYNCRHYEFPIVLGVSEPEYTEEQLEEIKRTNEEGFEYDGKHYTMYEGTQLQRKIETEVRKQKDIQILARAEDDKKLIAESQQKITMLNDKYNELNKASGLLARKDRMRVSQYRRVKV